MWIEAFLLFNYNVNIADIHMGFHFPLIKNPNAQPREF